MRQQLADLVAFTADASGAATFRVGPVPQSLQWNVNLSVPGAPFSATFSPSVGPVGWGYFQGPFGFGPIAIPSNMTLVVTATGLQPNTQYGASYIGVSDLATALDPVMPAPAAGLQTTDVQRSTPLVTSTTLKPIVSALFNPPPFACANVPGVRIYAANQAAQLCQIFVQWSDQFSTSGLPLFPRTFVLGPLGTGSALAVNVPHMGDQFHLAAQPGAGNLNLALYVAHTNLARYVYSAGVDPVSGALPDVLLYKDNGAVPAGAGNIVATSATIYAGPATFGFRTNAAAWEIALEALDGLNTWHSIAQFSNQMFVAGSPDGWTIPVTLPPAPIRCNITNSDGAPKNFAVSLTADAWRN